MLQVSDGEPLKDVLSDIFYDSQQLIAKKLELRKLEAKTAITHLGLWLAVGFSCAVLFILATGFLFIGIDDLFQDQASMSRAAAHLVTGVVGFIIMGSLLMPLVFQKKVKNATS